MAKSKAAPVEPTPERETPDTIESFDSPESGLIRGAIYDKDKLELLVTFTHTGFTYKYAGISNELWTQFHTAASKGSFFGKVIRPMYAGVRA